jgi:hypothetical protein
MKTTKELSRRRFLQMIALGAGCVLGLRWTNAQSAGGLVELKRDAATGVFAFDTDQISGAIQTEGAYHGVTQLTDKRTGRVLTDTRYSALNLYRLFSTNLGMGTPRDMPRTVKATATAVEIRWPASEAHQGEITARYEVRQPNLVDLTVTLRCRGTYAGYEILLPSYFDKVLAPHVYLKRRAKGKGPPETDLVAPMVNDVFRGGVLMFPRDAHTARHCVDGRWDRSEYKMPTAPFFPVRHYAHPLAFLADPQKQMAVVLMSQTRACAGVSCRYHAEKDEDRMTTYSAVDLSLFGDDLVPGDERTVRVRLAVTPLDEAMSQPMKLYEAFVAETEKP